MGDRVTHNCGLALVRLRRGLTYYRHKYGSYAWGLRQLYLLMEKQHNRGQDGAGLAVVKFDMPPGQQFLKRLRSDRRDAIERIFEVVMREVRVADEDPRDLAAEELKLACEFLGDVYLGHLRYATYAPPGQVNCHPYVRRSNVASRTLAIAGNFNMTNAGELFDRLVADGLSPVGDSDTLVILERIGHFLDRAHDRLETAQGPSSHGGSEGRVLADEVSRRLDLVSIIRSASKDWDGGYVFVGLVGNGDAFVVRDPNGIRPGFFYVDDDVVGAASERAALASVFDVDLERIEAIQPGHVLEIKRDGTIRHEPFTEPRESRQCTFERVYFSRGNDPDIYRERKALGRQLVPRLLGALHGDVHDAVFSFIPNTAESAYLGLIEALEQSISGSVRKERIAHKDQRLRTFITHDAARHDLMTHVYDITPGVVKPTDTLVMLDDSIVRGTTLRESIIPGLSRLNPARIVIVSSAPPIMYPDCYGINMSQLGQFIAFEAAVALLGERGEEGLCGEIERRCLAQARLPPEQMCNEVSTLYERFTLEEIAAKVAELVRPQLITWGGTVEIIYQDVDGLHRAMPDHTGDWYFTGRYPTPGGYRVLNTAYLNWRRGADVRAY